MPAAAAREDVVAQALDELGRALVLRRRRRDHGERRGVAGRVVAARRGGGDAGVGGDGARTRSSAASPPRGYARGQHERAVEAGAEALGERVVGLPRGASRAVVAVVGLAEAQRGERRGEHEQHERARPRRATGGATSSPPQRAKRSDGATCSGLRGRSRRAKAPIRTGSTVTAPIATAATTIAEPMPMRPTNGIPVASSPAIATTTIAPAAITDVPAVALAACAASRRRRPPRAARGSARRSGARSRCRRRGRASRRASARRSGRRRSGWRSERSRPPASAIPAATSVSSIAAAERKTSVRTMIATAMPISSPTGAGCCSAWSTIWPLRAVSMPARSVIAAVSARRSPGAAPGPAAGGSYWTVANAMRPSGETWRGVERVRPRR